jgi:hypothetical protein
MKSKREMSEAEKYDLVREEAGDDDSLMVVLSALAVGPNADHVAKFARLPRSYVRELGQRLRANGIWIGDQIACEYPERGPDGVEVAMWSLVATGMLEVARAEE